MEPRRLLDQLRGRTADMVDDLRLLVEVESPSDDVDALASSAVAVGDLGRRMLGADPERIDVDGRPTLRWRFGSEPRVLLLGHHDTVWPRGTLSRWPFEVNGVTGLATGPGAFDMKAGIVQGFYALSALSALDGLGGIEVLLTADEEVGSQRSVNLVRESAAGAVAALVLEPSASGALKVARKGTGMYTLAVEGRSAHAGLEPEKGANALVALSRLVLELEAIGRPDRGTTVTPTVAAAGTSTNTVPARARLEVDVRVAEPAEAERVDAELRALRAAVPGTKLIVHGGPNRPPMPASSATELFRLAESVNETLGLPALRGVNVGGASDGNFAAEVGCPTLDGLGAVGDGAHSEGEHVVVSAMAERAALLAALIAGTRLRPARDQSAIINDT